MVVTAFLPGDVNGDRTVDASDLALAKAANGSKIGQAKYNAQADFNGDGQINSTDTRLTQFNQGATVGPFPVYAPAATTAAPVATTAVTAVPVVATSTAQATTPTISATIPSTISIPTTQSTTVSYPTTTSSGTTYTYPTTTSSGTTYVVGQAVVQGPTAATPEPDTRIKEMSPDKLRGLLNLAFRNADSLDAQTKNVKFQGGEDSASLDYDLTIHNTMQSATSEYKFHVTMQMRPVDAPHFLGLYHTKEWRITGAQADGPDVGSYME